MCNDGVWELYMDAFLIEVGMAYDGLPSPDTGCPVPDFCYIYLVWNDYSIGYRFCPYPSPYDVSVHELFLWEKKGLYSHSPW